MAHRARKNEAGYSLLEIMFGLGLLAIVVMVANGQMFHIMKQARKVTDMGKQDSSFRGFGQRFMFDLQLADVALSFQRLPIPLTGCDSAGGKLKPGPCVYRMDGKKLVASSTKLGNARAIEFFSDLDSSLKAEGLKGATDEVKIVRMSKINNTQAAKNTFATWVLKDETSTPFTMMSRTHSGAYFTLADEYASSSPSGAAGRFVIMRGNSDDIDAADLKGRLMVVFNGYNPDQYFVQKIGQVIDCNNKGCDRIAKALNPMADTSTLEGHFAIELQPISGAPLGIPVTASGLGTWGLQGESQFMFPTQYASIHMASHSDFTPPIDARRMLHFYHSEQVRAQLLAIPIEFKGYYFEKSKGKKKRLLSKKITGAREAQVDVVLNDVDKNAYGVFARKIGTQDVSFFIYE
ncbi:hypothetical protein [Oligoflexus tunisiensis]|uniref:hypothetical protein n=1 Tax=Oligoflexus tunisiensis TaxID=708132 RepID=UPI00114CE4EC|nr:hypothetical protein [Oligoflexus tunisiensis]